MTWIILSRASSSLKIEKSRNLRKKGKYQTIYPLSWITTSYWSDGPFDFYFEAKVIDFFPLCLPCKFLLTFGKYFCFTIVTFTLWKVVVGGIKLTRKDKWLIKFKSQIYTRWTCFCKHSEKYLSILKSWENLEDIIEIKH